MGHYFIPEFWQLNKKPFWERIVHAALYMPGVGLMVSVVGLHCKDPSFKSCSAVELIPGGFDSAYHPSEVSKKEYQLAGILSRSGDPSRIVPNSPGDCLGSTDALHRVWSHWMDGIVGSSGVC